MGLVEVGGSFGELALLFGSKRNATIKVTQNTELITLNKRDFNKYMSFSASSDANKVIINYI